MNCWLQKESDLWYYFIVTIIIISFVGCDTSFAGYDLSKSQHQPTHWCSSIHLQFPTHTLCSPYIQSGLEVIVLKNVQANHQHMWFIDNYQLFTVINTNTTSKFFYLLCQTTYTAFAASVFIPCFSLKAVWSSLSSQVEHLEIEKNLTLLPLFWIDNNISEISNHTWEERTATVPLLPSPLAGEKNAWNAFK